MTSALEIRGLSLTLGEKLVLKEIDLTLEVGAFLGLIGPNGAGKTVLLKTIAGLLTPQKGEVRVFGRPPRAARGAIGYVPQFGAFERDFPISVGDVVRMGRLAHSWRERSARDRAVVRAVLERVGLQELEERRVGELSGGQIQRVLIARALAVEPQILLLDEPTASLDAPVGKSFYELLADLGQEITIVLVSHDIGVIAQHVKTIACLNQTLHYHHSRELDGEMLRQVYGCPVDLIAHGHAHRVLPQHEEGK